MGHLFSFLINNAHYVFTLLGLGVLIAFALAPLEAMGWWAGWWMRDSNTDPDRVDVAKGALPAQPAAADAPSADHFVVFLTGIGGSTEQVNVPLEMGFLQALRGQMPHACVIDTIYPYSVANRGLTEGRLLTGFWKWVLKEKLSGRRALGFMINVRNLLQVLVCADSRYGAFFSQGAAEVIARELRRARYDFASAVPLTIIGYSGGGQVAVGAAPYLAEVLPAPVRVISLGGVLSSNPKIDRIDQIIHIYSNKDSVQRLGMIFPGRWRTSFTSQWNRGRRAGRISSVFIPDVQHDGPGGYLDPNSTLSDGRSYLQRTVDIIVSLINQPLQPIPDEPDIAISPHQ